MNFFEKYKKILMIAGFIAVVLIFGYLLYYLFFKPLAPIGAPDTEPTATSTGPLGFPEAQTGQGQVSDTQGQDRLPIEKSPQTTGQISPIATGGITEAQKISDDSALAATLGTAENTIQYYNKNDGKFYTVTKDGNVKTLSDKVFPSVQKVTWAPSKAKAILEFPDGANIVYDFEQNKQVTLPSHWKDYDFSPNSNQIASKSMGLDPDNRWLIITNSDGSGARLVEPLGENEEYVDVSWSPNNQIIATYSEGGGFDRQNIYFVGKNKENFKSLTVEGRGLQYIWSPKGDQLLYSAYSTKTDMKPLLWAVRAEGETIGADRRSLDLLTWAHKCAFYEDTTVFCAVPQELDVGAGMFPEMQDNTVDNLYRIDINSGQKRLIAIPDGSHTIANIIVSQNGKYLFFTDKGSGNLFKINLQ